MPTLVTSLEPLSIADNGNVDGIVFNNELTKPDVLVLQNLAADIQDHLACGKEVQQCRHEGGPPANGLARLTTPAKRGNRDKGSTAHRSPIH